MRLAAALLLLPSMAVNCQEALDAISPNANVDPDSVPSPDPSDEPTVRYRSIDGTGNHLDIFELGAANTTLRRMTTVDYGDSVASMAGAGRASPREISNALCADTLPGPNLLGASDFLWQWGQFVDHDIDLTEAQSPAEPMPIAVPTGDPSFDPTSTGTATIDVDRSAYHPGTGNDLAYPRQQMNQISHFIDASNVYGSDDVRASTLRTNDGTGRLLLSAGDLLPFNTAGLPNAGGTDPGLFLAGDVRANEQVGLIAMHTLFAREHNRLAAQIAANDPTLTGEEIYQEARRIVGALMQVITYNEFLPALLGPNALPPYELLLEREPGHLQRIFDGHLSVWAQRLEPNLVAPRCSPEPNSGRQSPASRRVLPAGPSGGRRRHRADPARPRESGLLGDRYRVGRRRARLLVRASRCWWVRLGVAQYSARS